MFLRNLHVMVFILLRIFAEIFPRYFFTAFFIGDLKMLQWAFENDDGGYVPQGLILANVCTKIWELKKSGTSEIRRGKM